MRKIFFLLLTCILILFLCQSCSLFEDLLGTKDDNDQELDIKTEKKGGALVIEEGSEIDFDDLEVITLTDIGDLDQDGEFEVEGNISDKYQIVIFNLLHIVQSSPVCIHHCLLEPGHSCTPYNLKKQYRKHYQ